MRFTNFKYQKFNFLPYAQVLTEVTHEITPWANIINFTQQSNINPLKGDTLKGMIQFRYIGMTHHATNRSLLFISQILSDDSFSFLKMMIFKKALKNEAKMSVHDSHS